MATQKYHHGNLRSDLIRKGIRLLDAEGYEGLSLRKVAKACDVSHAAPYRHFRNKDDLIGAIVAEVTDEFAQTLQAAVDRHPDDPRSQLKEMGVAYVEFFVKNPAYLRLIFLSDGFGQPATIPADEDNCEKGTDRVYNNRAFDVLYRAVARFRTESQSGGSMSQEELILYCWGMVHGISMLIAKDQYRYRDGTLELARRVLWSEEFLG